MSSTYLWCRTCGNWRSAFVARFPANGTFSHLPAVNLFLFGLSTYQYILYFSRGAIFFKLLSWNLLMFRCSSLARVWRPYFHTVRLALEHRCSRSELKHTASQGDGWSSGFIGSVSEHKVSSRCPAPRFGRGFTKRP